MGYYCFSGRIIFLSTANFVKRALPQNYIKISVALYEKTAEQKQTKEKVLEKNKPLYIS